jgi:hypothetical protein
MDAGTQTRLFRFAPPAQASGDRTLQGTSVAQWMRPPPAFNGNTLNQQVGLPGRAPPARNAAPAAPPGPPVARGSLKVNTTNLTAGYLRRNGIPYSENAVVTEYYDRISFFGVDYLQLTTIVQDPAYLTVPFVVSNQFKREPDGSKWNPTACRTDPPGKTSPPVGTFNGQDGRIQQ